ncbi:MAG: hypothetical protein AAF328_08515 [Planctomycetota bacterium]
MNNHSDALAAAERIAREVLGLETLEERKMDSLDFKEQAVWNIKRALLDAYAAGLEDKTCRQRELLTAARELLGAHEAPDETPAAYRRTRDAWRGLKTAVEQSC